MYVQTIQGVVSGIELHEVRSGSSCRLAEVLSTMAAGIRWTIWYTAEPRTTMVAFRQDNHYCLNMYGPSPGYGSSCILPGILNMYKNHLMHTVRLVDHTKYLYNAHVHGRSSLHTSCIRNPSLHKPRAKRKSGLQVQDV